MTTEEFRKDFLETVRSRAAADNNFQLSAFVDAAVETLVEGGEFADFEPSHYRGVGSRKRALWIDGYAFDDADGSVRLLVADWRGEDDTATLTQTEAKTVLGRVRAFVEDARAGRIHNDVDLATEVAGLSRSLYEERGSTARYRIYLVSDAVLSERVKDWPEGDIDGIPADFHIWDINRIHRVTESKTGRDDLEINFDRYRVGGLPCLEAGVNSDDYKAYLCIVPGKVLAELYSEYGSRLLEGNVRSFLTAKGKINKGIRNTLLNEPGMFFAYNNGIAATATEADIRNTAHGLSLLRATDLQIVNGGQTTASLANALAEPAALANLGSVFVQMKLSVVSPERSGEVIPLIAKYANSQNRVSEADFFSNHEFHRRMEQISRRVWAPAVGGAQHETHWFYERARGQFMNEQAKMTKAEKTRFLAQNPRAQFITKTDLAKTENAWRGLPHTVSLGAQKNFLVFAQWVTEAWEKSNANFNDEYFRRAVVKMLIFRHTERLVSQQQWYQGGYRANIVAYAVAKLAATIEVAGKAIDYHEYWSKQSISSAMERKLVTVSKKVFKIITEPPAGIQNVTEWAKKELCWTKVSDLEIPLSNELLAELVDKDTDRSRRDGARAEQGAVNRITAQIDVMNLGAAYWAALLAWARPKNLLSQEQVKLLGVATKMPMMIPTERQSVKLLELNASMAEEGFRHVS
jgi:hypothetical protein